MKSPESRYTSTTINQGEISSLTNRNNAPLWVLLIQEDPAEAMLVCEALEEAAYTAFEVITANSLEEASAGLNFADFDVALLDLDSYPDQEPEALDWIQQIGRAIPIVALSAAPDERLALATIKLGAQDCLFKNEVGTPLLERALRRAAQRHWQGKPAKEVSQLPEPPGIIPLAQFKAVLDGLDAGITLTNDRGEIIWANRHYNDYFGIPAECPFPEMQSAAPLYLDFANPERDPAAASPVLEDPRYAGPLDDIEIDQPEHRILQRFTTPIDYEQAQYTSRLWVYRDVTDQRLLEERVLQSDKMDSIGRLAGGIAHDFNNLLTAIQGYAQLGMISVPSTHPVAASLEEIQKATNQAINLTKQLLIFARRRPLELVSVNLSELVLQLDKLLRRLIGAHIELVVLPASGIHTIKADPVQIEQVLINMVVNARDAMPDGGKLIIQTDNVTLNEHQVRQHQGIGPGSYCVLTISDTGVGMTEEVLAHIFEPFFTTKKEGEGTGLGLATCYGIVKQFSGHIEVSSKTGQGTTFKIYLPVSLAEAVPQQDEENQGLASGSEKILLTEDEPLVRSMVSHMLRAQGYQVVEAQNGVEALSLLNKMGDNPIDLLITDVVMPQMVGTELASQVKAAFPQTKVIFISGYYQSMTTYKEMQELSGSEFLQKPFTLETLASKVREVLDN